MEMLTSVKAVKGQSEMEKQRVMAFNDLFSTAVSRIRQPIESLFNRLNEKQLFKERKKSDPLPDS